MKQYPAEKKLLLAKMLRDQNQNNRMVMQKCEQVMYGTRVPVNASFIREDFPAGEVREPSGAFVSLKLRFFLAFLLFAGFVAWDNGYYPALGDHTAQIYEWIGEDGVLSELSAFLDAAAQEPIQE